MDELKKLIDVKSLVTLVLTGVFAFLAIKQVISGDQFLTIFSVVISFYFGTQYQKNKSKVDSIDDEVEKFNPDYMTMADANAIFDDIYSKIEELNDSKDDEITDEDFDRLLNQ